MKNCTKCQLLKDNSEFSIRNKNTGTLQPWCKTCLSEHNRKVYKEKPNRKQQVKASSLKYKAQMEQFLFDYLSAHPCIECGMTDILTLQFDHLRDKDFTIACQATSSSISTIKAEIEKCQVLCANCHSRKTALSNNNWKLKWLARSDSN